MISVVISIMVSITVAMIVSPRPILLLLFRRELPEVAVSVAVGLVSPAVVIHDFVVVPIVIIGVVGVVDPVGMVLASNSSQRRGQGCRQKDRIQQVRTTTHGSLL